METNTPEEMAGLENQRPEREQAPREEPARYEAGPGEGAAPMLPASSGLERKKASPDEREALTEVRENETAAAKRKLASPEKALEADEPEPDKPLSGMELREDWLSEWDKALSAREQSVHERELAVRTAELESRQKIDEAHRALEAELLDARKEALAEAKKERRKQMSKLEEDIAAMRAEAEKAIAKREKEARELIDQLYHEAETRRNEEYKTLDGKLDGLRQETSTQCEKLLADAMAEVKAMQAAQQEQCDEQTSRLETWEAELRDREQALVEERAEVDKIRAKNFRQEALQSRKEDELDAREAELSEAVEKKSQDVIRNYEAQLSGKDSALEQLRSHLAGLEKEMAAVEDFKQIYGGSPAMIRSQITKLKKDNEELEQRLAASPSKTVQAERDQLRDECGRIREENLKLQERAAELLEAQRGSDRVQAENARLQDKLQDLEHRFSDLQGYYEAAQAEIQRLSSAQSRLIEQKERMKAIQAGGDDDDIKPLRGDEYGAGASGAAECQWLDNIWNNCKEFGIVFPRRILYAFHTALKISDWSMITVLSGVSGTGKSELPKLYAEFGGFNFINVPVQPSWDSQESMLGFFNSIDNRFEPEPLLRFLFKCTEDPEYNRYMSIVLLDEMNLAHVEHYFADFLSKLESRRSKDKEHLPKVEVKLGAGVEPYRLKLTRTILWTGTMNQDETTKSLSDKVLDRGLVLCFPRPTRLTGRKKMVNLDRAVMRSGRTLMTEDAWKQWLIRSLDKDEAGGSDAVGDAARARMDHYRSLVEQINQELERTGRALGHRVWQAIEYYIVNYPTVRKSVQENKDELTPELREAMDTAFEDQLVQKVMPKLRGIETRGEDRERLQAIEDLLEKAGFGRLKDDFDLAMKLGYGQFIWSSAKYIQEDDGGKTGADDSGPEEEAGTPS